ncbi:MAG: ankyrin repeat domain-containing protein [Myxococcales bacterium]|nr:ankyrin repeat domain-containing protein [Myxococcales bacterium]
MWKKVLNRPIVQGQSALHLAVMAGKVRTVRWMLQHGANPDDHDLDGLGAVHCAVMHDDVNVATSLLSALMDAGLSIDSEDTDDGATALHTASFLGRDKLVAWLLDRGADVHGRDYFGRTPLMRALSMSEHKVAARLLGHGANPNEADEHGEPTLLQARMTPKGSDLLLKAGANLQGTDSQQRNLLHLAALRGNGPMLTWALRKGVDPTHLDEDGLTPLAALEMELVGLGTLRFAQALGLQTDEEASVLEEPEEGFDAALRLLRLHQPGPMAHA